MTEPNSNCFVPKQRYPRRPVRPIQIFTTKRYWILFRIGPERRRGAGMPTDVCLFSNSPDPIVPIFGTSSAKVTEWVSCQSLKRTPHSLDREDRQDFVIRCQTYSNSNSPDSDRGDHRNTSYQQILGISISIRSEIDLLLRMLIE